MTRGLRRSEHARAHCGAHRIIDIRFCCRLWFVVRNLKRVDSTQIPTEAREAMENPQLLLRSFSRLATMFFVATTGVSLAHCSTSETVATRGTSTTKTTT